MRRFIQILSVCFLLTMLAASPRARADIIPADDGGLQIYVVGVDDLAVAASIVSIASGLKNLFGGSDADYKPVLEGIARLEQQNGKILTLLTRALAILENIDVIVAREVRDGFLVDLRTDISSSMELWRETAAALVKDPRYRSEATKTFEKLYEDQFRRLSRKIAGYGPGIFPTYGELMGYEYTTGRFLKRNKAEREAAFEQYVNRFNEFLDPKRPDSIEAAYIRTGELVRQINSGLDAADADLARNRIFTLERGHKFSKSCGPGMMGQRTWKQDHMARVDGDRKAGYSSSDYWGPKYDEDEYCEPRDHFCRLCFALNQIRSEATKAVAAALPPDPGWADPAAKAVWLNGLRGMEAAANSDFELAKAARAGAIAYRDTAAAWLAEIRQ